MSYPPIENHGLIGNMRTAALVALNGSIDWMCWPDFDSPSIFAALLDDHRGGRFQICPQAAPKTKQFYWPGTNVLVTRFLMPDGVGEVLDFFAVGTSLADRLKRPLVRRVRVMRGAVTFALLCEPAPDYAREKPNLEITGDRLRISGKAIDLTLITSVPLRRTEGGVRASFTLKQGEFCDFVLSGGDPPLLTSLEVDELFEGTVTYWRQWLRQSHYRGRWREMVERSALCLKLLTYEPTGAVVAAPTCSLPEFIGGTRNWDYRYTWIRDAAFTTYALVRLGFHGEARCFMDFLEARCHELEGGGELQIVYGIDGRHELTESELTHLEGYRGSAPVRVGNDAWKQLQLDIYGEMMDSVYLSNKYSSPISWELWRHLRNVVDWVCNNWMREDEGIWEVRSGRRHFVYSKLMCWVALDRAIRIATARSLPADPMRWLDVRNQIFDAIMTRGWDEERGCFVQSFDSHTLDASNLMMPLVFFIAPNDPRMIRMLETISSSPERGGLVSDSLVYRYDTAVSPDGVGGREGTFNMCSFWLVDALTRAGQFQPQYLEQARVVFERMLGYSNHVGLYAEQTGVSGEALGNFPQAFTHLALISAAFNLDNALGAPKH